MENATKMLPNVEAALVHLRDGDLLVCTMCGEGVSPEARHRIAQQLCAVVKNTGRHEVGILLVDETVQVDLLSSDKRVAALENEIAELKATVAKYLTKG